tara:strand:+ start:1306 stop:1509 length:204 start_codon:yes stop_codon:yes gene_type:complete
MTPKNYMHQVTGDVATEAEWRGDYESMDLESWFGKDIDNITAGDIENWLDCDGKLIEVTQNDLGEWE